MSEVQIRGDTIKKVFHVGTQEIEVLKGISFEIEKGDFVIVSGPSGCGKSTLLHTILGLEPPTSGRILFFDQDLYLNTAEDDRSIFRKRHIGMVYQQANWIKALNVRENVSFPLTLLGVSKHEAFTKSLKILNDLGMGSWAEYVPLELSSGQQQRVALARSLVNDPKVIVADEPTGNLDFKSGVEIMELLSKLNRELQKTIIMVTHDLEYLKYANKVIRIFDGNLEGVYTGDMLKKLTGSVSLKRGSVDFDEDRNAVTKDSSNNNNGKNEDEGKILYSAQQKELEVTTPVEPSGTSGAPQRTDPGATPMVESKASEISVGSSDLLSKNATEITPSSGIVSPPGETQKTDNDQNVVFADSNTGVTKGVDEILQWNEDAKKDQNIVREEEPVLVGGPVKIVKKAKPRKFKM